MRARPRARSPNFRRPPTRGPACASSPLSRARAGHRRIGQEAGPNGDGPHNRCGRRSAHLRLNRS
ncbi:hypothetical protein QQ25_02710 [Mycolicibacterium setense]|nr:hypothetical protein QQ25_02710 [Mycolicibacterium setense]